ncbi:related to flavin-containing monooxygenase [Cephalotrichum gorgonifer]|uniref:Related to flavin-containing monooxygenase n=1 Tax=Cephalotrichum gorgonifer TaxID=2041049 RepID=A0AAE8N2I9_9PEZI|nr:related to flavin-containing monooxygenase [Cephalotrichum gorgonifer]
MGGQKIIKSVAIIGAGPAGAVTAAAFEAEKYFDHIRVFERRETAGGTWIYDRDPGSVPLHLRPGKLPLDIDPPLDLPDRLPAITAPSQQERFSKTPVYESLMTNVPDIAMSFSDLKFAYGPFAPHYIPRQYVENYFSSHHADDFLVLNTTVEDLSRQPPTATAGRSPPWKLTLRQYDPLRKADVWWEETFDAVVLANGHYSVPYVPRVKGLDEYIQRFPGRVTHSKPYRSPLPYSGKKVLVIGNSASGIDITKELLGSAQLPVYQSRRSKSRWDGDTAPDGIEWKPIIEEYRSDGRIVFADGTYLDDVDHVIYCTGYLPSFPFWNEKANGRPLWDYASQKIVKGYWHTFFQDFENLGIVGLPRALTFRSFEYQAIALARLFSGRASAQLPQVQEQERWEREREARTKRDRKRFHDIPWETGENLKYLGGLFDIAGLGTLTGEGMIPPVLSKELIWAYENLRRYKPPTNDKGGDHSRGGSKASEQKGEDEDGDWAMVGPDSISL